MVEKNDKFWEDIQITYIGKENILFFLPIMGGELEENEVALGAIKNGVPVGVIVFSVDENSSELRYLFVEESCRRKGVATRFFTEAVNVFREVGVEDMLCYYSKQPDVTAFLEKQGVICTPSSKMYGMDVQEILSSAQIRKLSQKAKGVTVLSFADLSPKQIKACRYMLSTHPMFDEILLEEDNYKKEFSFVYMENEQPQSMMIVNVIDTEGKRDYYVSLALSVSGDRLPILYAFYGFYEILQSQNQNGKIYFLAYNSKIVHYFGEALGHPLDEELEAWTAYMDFTSNFFA